MGIIFYGSRRVIIGMDEYMMKCPACEAHNFADVLFKSVYYHFYFVPIFPYDKEVDIVCQKCGLKRYGIPLHPGLFSEYEEVKKKFKHPWYSYSVTVFAVILILTAFLARHW